MRLSFFELGPSPPDSLCSLAGGMHYLYYNQNAAKRRKLVVNYRQ